MAHHVTSLFPLTKRGFFQTRLLKETKLLNLPTHPTRVVSMDANKRELRGGESKATVEEFEQGWDTQYCQRLQDELLSVRLANDRDEATYH